MWVYALQVGSWRVLSAATLCTGSAQAAVNGFTCLNNRRHRHENSVSIAVPLVAGYRDRCRFSSVAALAGTAALLGSTACSAFVFLAGVARMSAATSGVVVLTDLRALASPRHCERSEAIHVSTWGARRMGGAKRYPSPHPPTGYVVPSSRRFLSRFSPRVLCFATDFLISAPTISRPKAD
jgi:hypothetical protein